MFKIRFAQRESGRWPANEFLEALQKKDRNSYDKLIRAFEKFEEHGPDGVSRLYKALQTQAGIVQFTIWKYRVLGYRSGNEVFLTNGFKKDQDETSDEELTRAHEIKAEHLRVLAKAKKNPQKS